MHNFSRTNTALLYNLLFITSKRMLTYLLPLLYVIRNTWITCYWGSFLSAVSITSTKFSLIQRHTSWNLQPQETSLYLHKWHYLTYVLDISIDNCYCIKELLHSLITAGFWEFENIGSNYAILLLKCILKPITMQNTTAVQ